MKTSDLKAGPIIHQNLPEAFINRVKDFMAVIAEVDNTPLEDFMESFQRDHHPETELKTWEKIAATYQWAVLGTPGLTIAQKKDVFTIVLGLSMGMLDFTNCQNLSTEQVAGIVSQFTQNSTPA